MRPRHLATLPLTPWTWLPVWVLLCLTASAYAAAPESNPAAKQDLCKQVESCSQHYASAKELSTAGKLIPAIEEYEAAYREVQLPVFLYNIGRMHHRIGNLVQAANYYRRFIAAAADDEQEQQARARAHLNQIEALLSAAALQPPGAATATAKRPIYKTCWFWTLTGTAVAGITIGIVAAVFSSKSGLPANTLKFSLVNSGLGGVTP